MLQCRVDAQSARDDQALRKLDNSEPMHHHVDDASSALYINDPKKGGGFQKLFYTHPPISERLSVEHM